MKTIETRRKKVKFIIDDIDYLLALSGGWTWSKSKSNWYISRMKNGKKEYLHRLIMRAQRGHIVDHINGNSLDNRRSNLRICTNADNVHNMRRLPRHNTSGYKGVSYNKRECKWIAYIKVMGKIKHLGYFMTAKDAALAYDEAAKRFFGNFAAINADIIR